MAEIYVFHLEDEPQFIDLIREIVEEIDELKYRHFNDFDDIVEKLSSAPVDPAILIFDLRIGNSQPTRSRHMTWLQEHGGDLMNKHCSVLVLSAYIQKHDKDDLIEFGKIPRDQIFVKDDTFSEQDFHKALIAARDNIKGHLSELEIARQQSYRFIHLSDIHFGQDVPNLTLHEDIRHEILRDIKRLHRARGSADAILINGDTAYSGKLSEYEEASEWLNKVTAVAGCQTSDICLIPGNHDIDLSFIDTMTKLTHENIRATSNLNQLTQKINDIASDPKASQDLLAKLQNYQNFASQYGCNFDSVSKPFWIRELNKLAPVKLHLWGLNTVLTSDRNDRNDNDNKKLVLNQEQYIHHRQDNVICIAMFHHPLEWLKHSEEIRSYLTKRASIWLMGHEHKLEVKPNVEKGGCWLEIHAGATNPPSTDNDTAGKYEYRYNWLEISTRRIDGVYDLKVSVFPRLWTHNKRFEPDYRLLSGKEFEDYYLPIEFTQF